MDTILKEGLKKVKIKLGDRNFYLSQGKAEGFKHENKKDYVYRTRVYIEYNGHKTSFLFHGSINDYQNQKAYYKEDQFPFLLYCFISDSHSGDLEFHDFCENFGYDMDSLNAYKIHKACKRSTEKLFKLGIQSESHICDLLNELNEKYEWIEFN